MEFDIFYDDQDKLLVDEFTARHEALVALIDEAETISDAYKLDLFKEAITELHRDNPNHAYKLIGRRQY